MSYIVSALSSNSSSSSTFRWRISKLKSRQEYSRDGPIERRPIDRGNLLIRRVKPYDTIGKTCLGQSKTNVPQAT
eukprot:1195870-Prorocentrum_minimum.AAC.2